MGEIVISKEYGYVLSTFTASALYLFSLGIQVGKYRRAADVPYPYAYAERAEAEKDPKKHLFNCAQRVHQNNLEVFPVYSSLLLVGGISHPVYASAAGAVFLIGRAVYSANYLSGDPKKRVRGAFYSLGLLALLGMTGSTLYNLLLQ
ncbi:hypothetical protein BDB00DRAFT_800050 [Zychaea mexicana]|uniref:uncharacterized protein n=1 Tax=Zychaea mexicana TaxID=64656 RepID=UPI0022FEA75A|nr:uncharacterized protein BDB00DRAFT_800050 [Zychaea mexicana]KAI9498371.1 hypothetical protein BDB00DRAFT_800050 [Zychaea mexicana]